MLNRLSSFACVFALASSLLGTTDAAEKPLHIVTLGDSITKGVRSGVTADQTFSSLLEKDLKEAGLQVKVTNVGIGGERTDQAYKRLARVMDLEPDFVVIMYGTNDSYVDQGKSESRITRAIYSHNLVRLVTDLRNHGVVPVFMTEPRWADDVRKNGAGEHPNLRLEQYLDECRANADQFRVPVVDHYALWTRARSDGVNLRDWTTDGCHPNPAGHRQIANALVPVMRRVIADRQAMIELSPLYKERCLKVLSEGVKSEEFWPSIHAAEGLTLGGHGHHAVQLLTPRLSQDLDDQQKIGVLREFVRAGYKSRKRQMLAILEGENTFGHIHAAESLYKVKEIGDGVAMRKAFEQKDDMRLRVMSAAALARCGNPDAMAFIRGEVLSHNDPEVYKLGAWILGRIGDTSDVPRLRKNLSRCPDVLTRAYFENSLAALGDKDGLAALAESLKSEDSAVRTYAATFAGDSRAVGVKDALKSMLHDSYPDARYRAAQSLLEMTQQPKLHRTADVSSLVWQASDSNPRYTEGSIVEMSNGALLFAATEFHGSGSDFAKARIVARVSNNDGRSWGRKRVLQENTGGMNVMSVTLRRFENVSDRQRGIAMFYLQKNGFDDLDMYVRFSHSEGAMFGEPILVTADDGYHVVNNDRVTELSSGRILVPAASTSDVKKVNHFVSHCYISDDGGKTWRKGKGQVDAPKRGAMEPEVVELNDGRVLMIVRTQLGYIGKSYSSDGGETWSELESLGVKAPEAPATLRRVPSTGDLLLIWNDNFEEGKGHGGKRTPLSAAISSDEGETWRKVGNLESDSERTYSYTSLTFVRERAVMSYWESEKDGKLSCRFRSLPVSWFYRD